jgi:hypothetical protein
MRSARVLVQGQRKCELVIGRAVTATEPEGILKCVARRESGTAELHVFLSVMQPDRS